jgi:hypothetical protein
LSADVQQREFSFTFPVHHMLSGDGRSLLTRARAWKVGIDAAPLSQSGESRATLVSENVVEIKNIRQSSTNDQI